MRQDQPARQAQRKILPYAAILTGAGLLIVGLIMALLAASPRGDAEDTGSSPGDTAYSVVPAKVNYAAPELSLNTLGGAEASLTDYRGQVVLVNNWATWCPPCKAEMPTLQDYYEEHKGQGFILIGIEAGEPAEDVAEFVDKYKLTFPIWLDPQSEALYVFNTNSLPSSFVIDEAGVVRLAWVGEISKAMLEKYVTPLLED